MCKCFDSFNVADFNFLKAREVRQHEVILYRLDFLLGRSIS